MSMKFADGSRVRVSFSAVVNSSGNGEIWMTAGKIKRTFIILDDDDDFCIEQELPENWPPQEGDVWMSDKYGLAYHFLGEKFRKTSFTDPDSIISRTQDEIRSNYPDVRLAFRIK
jgi:hypothetical protein